MSIGGYQQYQSIELCSLFLALANQRHVRSEKEGRVHGQARFLVPTKYVG